VFTRTQRPKEKARDYIAQMQRLMPFVMSSSVGFTAWNVSSRCSVYKLTRTNI